MTDDAVPARVSLRSGGMRERQVWPDQVHAFQALPRWSPEAAKAMAHVSHFIDTSLQANAVDAERKAGWE
jgi:epsilon-lactone hydrolase